MRAVEIGEEGTETHCIIMLDGEMSNGNQYFPLSQTRNDPVIYYPDAFIEFSVFGEKWKMATDSFRYSFDVILSDGSAYFVFGYGMGEIGHLNISTGVIDFSEKIIANVTREYKILSQNPGDAEPTILFERKDQ
ncbi:hypothetical protein HHL28_00110 [Aerophototrophica crusticola]|uniref:Uncharacterized protein n=1 Tax=Aerophototrophica crusticola TaxID=1709002 RepID=A0A858R3Q0_9PROT|nr:hypothetical protein HHL28_00110 [Rhodospirillaceae bacterium B3]